LVSVFEKLRGYSRVLETESALRVATTTTGIRCDKETIGFHR
jgi:hypothetical protein